jgi:hypothetical protein
MGENAGGAEKFPSPQFSCPNTQIKIIFFTISNFPFLFRLFG